MVRTAPETPNSRLQKTKKLLQNQSIEKDATLLKQNANYHSNYDNVFLVSFLMVRDHKVCLLENVVIIDVCSGFFKRFMLFDRRARV
jgi:hypothetical protein